jgi:hypothetical protein
MALEGETTTNFCECLGSKLPSPRPPDAAKKIQNGTHHSDSSAWTLSEDGERIYLHHGMRGAFFHWIGPREHVQKTGSFCSSDMVVSCQVSLQFRIFKHVNLGFFKDPPANSSQRSAVPTNPWQAITFQESC